MKILKKFDRIIFKEIGKLKLCFKKKKPVGKIGSRILAAQT
jgi:hypothetical protein